jgi:hypothetical protein
MNGKTVASAITAVAAFLPDTVMPSVSASRTRVYYLNGGVDVRYLAPDGASDHITYLKLNPTNEQAGFSVSPDDTRIAVSVFTYDLTSPPTFKGMRLYVENLDGTNHLDIFSSTSLAEFPVGWVGGHLILAVSQPVCCQQRPINPYGASAYHVVNADNADRLVTLCSPDAAPEGPIEPFGVLCGSTGPPSFLSWDGGPLRAPAAIPSPGPHLNAASPDGQLVAVSQATISIWGPNGGNDNLTVSGDVYGWPDNTHVVMRATGDAWLSILSLDTRSTTAVSGAAEYLGTFPAALS